jgi:hypothetical protein
VAVAGPTEVGFDKQGATNGPWSFDVAPDGRIWLLDEVNDRLLWWASGQPHQPHVVKLPYVAAEDMAIGPDGTIYVSFKPAGPDPWMLYAIRSTGAVKWSLSLMALDRGTHGVRTFNDWLRLAPDGTLYEVGGYGGPVTLWTPLTTSTGDRLPADLQWSSRLTAQPMPGGSRLTATRVSAREWHYVLSDPKGRVQHAVKLISGTDFSDQWNHPVLESTTLVLEPDLFKNATGPGFPWEIVPLRISLTTGAVATLTLSPRTVFGDAISTLRIGPDGKVYQLSNSLKAGASIARYTLADWPATPTTTTATSPRGTPSGTPTTTPATSTAPPVPTQAGPGSSSGGATGPLPWAIGGVAAAAAAATGGWYWRHRAHHVPTGG